MSNSRPLPLPETMTMTEIAAAAGCSVQYVHKVLRDVRHKGWAPGGTRSKVNRGPTKLYPSTWVAEVIKRREIVAAKHAKNGRPGTGQAFKYTLPPGQDLVTRTDISKAVHDSGTGTHRWVKKMGIKPVYEGATTLYARADAERVVAGYAKRAADAREAAKAQAAPVAPERKKMTRAECAKVAAEARWGRATPVPRRLVEMAEALRRGDVASPAKPTPGFAAITPMGHTGPRAATVDDVDALRLFISDDLKRLLDIFERSAGNTTIQDALLGLDVRVDALGASDPSKLRALILDEFAGLGKRITALGSTADVAATRVDILAQRLEALISRGEKNHVTLTGVSPKFDEMDRRLDDITRMVRGINSRLDGVALGPKLPAGVPPFNPVLVPGDR